MVGRGEGEKRRGRKKRKVSWREEERGSREGEGRGGRGWKRSRRSGKRQR